MDFTIKIYERLLDELEKANYTFQPFVDFIQDPAIRSITLRHDVDDKKLNSLHFAEIQADRGIRATYYFRIVSKSYDADIIKKIASLGHEIGYHYETMDTMHGNVDKAYDEFCKNLEVFQKITPVKTICMHGSPLSKHDNRDLWKKYDYKELGLVAEPYFDVDFNEVLYLTDTGRRWNGDKVSVRDKVKVEDRGTKIEERAAHQHASFHSTKEIITAATNKNLPNQLMMTFHPQRWTDKPGPWVKELVFQNIRNVIKRFIVR